MKMSEEVKPRCQKWSWGVRSEWRSQKWCEKYLFSRSHFLVWRFLPTITDHVFKTSLSMLLDHLEGLSSRDSFERKTRNTQRGTQIYSYRKLVENCMRGMQIFKVRCKLCKLSIYHSYTIFLTHTCSLKIERKIRYLCCSSMQMQDSFDFTFFRAVKILFISLQHLTALLLNFSIISFHSLMWFSRFLLFIQSCWIVSFSWLISYSTIRLLFDSMTASSSHLLISRANLILSWCSSSILATKLTFCLWSSRNLLSSQSNIWLTKDEQHVQILPHSVPEFPIV